MRLVGSQNPHSPLPAETSTFPWGPAEVTGEPGRNKAAPHLSQNVPMGWNDGIRSSVPAKAACSPQLLRNGPSTHSGAHQPLTHLDRKQEGGRREEPWLGLYDSCRGRGQLQTFWIGQEVKHRS